VPLLTRDHVQLGTSVVGYGTTPGSLDGEYTNCPSWVGGPYSEEWHDGRLATTVERIPYRKLLSPKTKQIVVHGGDVTCYDSSGTVRCGSETGEFKGKLVIAYKLVLKRKK
jgi:hypothetical protein